MCAAERTLNMSVMVVTRDVSKLSGWLNADARCRVEGHAIYGARCANRKARELGCGAAAGASGAHADDPRLARGAWGLGTRGARGTW